MSLPEVYDYARQALFPGKDGAVQPVRQRGGHQLERRRPRDGRGHAPAAAVCRQNRIETLAGEVEQALVRVPEWKTGKALLAVIDLERGRTEQARKNWQELLDDKQNPMPPMCANIIGQA